MKLKRDLESISDLPLPFHNRWGWACWSQEWIVSQMWKFSNSAIFSWKKNNATGREDRPFYMDHGPEFISKILHADSNLLDPAMVNT
jgi:hypothetical protein